MTFAKVVIINPPARASAERQYARIALPRLGPGYLASYLEGKGVEAKIIDARFQGVSFDQVVEDVAAFKPDLVGLTALTPEILDAVQLAGEVKRVMPGVPTIIGGAHATILPQRTMDEFPVFDYLAIGEGEETLWELVSALGGRATVEDILGLAYRRSSVRVNAARSFNQDLDRLPPPAWHLLPTAREYPILASRGCPFHCQFCNRVLGNKIRLRSPAKILDEMENIVDRFHPRSFEFNDETFGVNQRHVTELLDGIMARGLHKRVRWHVTTRVDVMKYPLLKRMTEAGCTSIGVGVESGNQKILDATGKGITLDQVTKAISEARRAGLRTNAFFILGHPYETKETVQDTIDFAAKLNTTRVNFGIMVPFPGTVVADMAERGEGNYKLISKDWADYGKQMGNVLELTTISRKELEQAQFRGYVAFYLRHNLSIAKLVRAAREIGLGTILSYFRWIGRRRKLAEQVGRSG